MCKDMLAHGGQDPVDTLHMVDQSFENGAESAATTALLSLLTHAEASRKTLDKPVKGWLQRLNQSSPAGVVSLAATRPALSQGPHLVLNSKQDSEQESETREKEQETERSSKATSLKRRKSEAKPKKSVAKRPKLSDDDAGLPEEWCEDCQQEEELPQAEAWKRVREDPLEAIRNQTRTGYLGVSVRSSGKFRAVCGRNPCGPNHRLGEFEDMDSAAQCMLKHMQERHTEQLEGLMQRYVNANTKLRPIVEDELLRSHWGETQTGFKGVAPAGKMYRAHCTTPPCHGVWLGNWKTPQMAAQCLLQHLEQHHPIQLKEFQMRQKSKFDLRPVKLSALIRSDETKTGYKCVRALRRENKNRFVACCGVCQGYYLGIQDTAELAAQMYLQHCEDVHPHQL